MQNDKATGRVKVLKTPGGAARHGWDSSSSHASHTSESR